MACQNNPILINGIFKNALTGRFFIAAILILNSALSYAENKRTEPCVSTHFQEKAFIDYVIDGDTVILKDKRHIRLIGINTPEIGRDDQPTEPGAFAARENLIEILRQQSNIQLIYGQKRHDHYGRALAHLFLNDGTNVQARLLEAGLAMPLRIPPNIAFAECYEHASRYAKNRARGLWALSRYKIHDVTELSGTESGFYFISGKVKQVTESRSSLWINLNNNVALRIKKEDLHYFDKAQLDSLKGKTIEAGGWLYERNKQLRMRLRHKLDLNVQK